MDFIEKLDEHYVKLGILVVFAIGQFIVARKNNLKLTLQYHLYAYGIMMFLLSLTIPHVLRYPYEISDLEDKKRLLNHFHSNNEAINKTTKVIREMCLLTFIFLVSVISKMIKHYKIDKSME